MNINDYDVLIVGSGLSGSVIAEQFAENNKKVLIIDKRNHIGGNCYDYINDIGIRVNKYGAHIFHTNNEIVWNYVTNFSEWERWDHKVIANINDKIIPLPININTINSLYNLNLKDDIDMKNYLNSIKISYVYKEINNSEETVLSKVGIDIYNKIFKNYTKKQWNKYPNELDKSVLDRIPIRYNFDNRYFTDKYQALPKYGYTEFINNILSHNNITIKLNTDFFELKNNINIPIIIFTGPIDRYFNNIEKLEYRSLKFIHENILNMNYYQSNSVVNYPSNNILYTRIIEYKHFLNQFSPHTTIVKEISCDDGEPYYPVPNKKNLELYDKYKNLAEIEKIKNIHFIGRLANYKYFNMDETILNALNYYKNNFQI
jgi:UDP-galactopyranose mutase